MIVTILKPMLKYPPSLILHREIKQICPEKHSRAYQALIPLEKKEPTEKIRGLPINLIDYMANVWSKDGYFFQGMRNKSCLKPEWLGLLNSISRNKPLEAYFNLLKSVRYENPTTKPLSSFQITPSLQEIVPFLCAYGLPVGNGLLDVRNLLVIVNDRLVFTPTELNFLNALESLHQLSTYGLIEIKERPKYIDNKYPEFVVKMESSMAEMEDHRMGMAIDIPNTEIYTNPQQFLGKKWNYQNQSNQEKIILPYINDLVVRFVTRFIRTGEGDWYQFQRSLENLGLPHLLAIWQNKL